MGSEFESMSMPMDSEEVLQEFANPDPDSLNNNKSNQTKEVTEGWFTRTFRWAPTSSLLLEQAENRILSYIKTGHNSKYVDIGSVETSHCTWSRCQKTEERRIWTVTFNEGVSDKLPLVLVHGLCAALGLWALNVDALAESRTVYGIDLLGFGRSSRPTFARDAGMAEEQHVEAIEAWRKKMNLERFVMLGHSMGGFLSAAYALKYPERVAHLVLADPWGMPKKPENVKLEPPPDSPRKPSPVAIKIVTTIGQKINAMAVVRVAGPFGPGLVEKARPDLVKKFEALNQSGTANVADYIYHCNAQKPAGEEAFRTIMDFFGWAKNPIVNRLDQLKPEIPLTMMYGKNTFLRHIPEDTIRELRPDAKYIQVHILPNSGHHVYADDITLFNSIVNEAAALADKLFGH